MINVEAHAAHCPMAKAITIYRIMTYTCLRNVVSVITFACDTTAGLCLSSLTQTKQHAFCYVGMLLYIVVALASKRRISPVVSDVRTVHDAEATQQKHKEPLLPHIIQTDSKRTQA